MSDDDRVDVARGHGEGFPIATPDRPRTLEHPAVDEDASGRGREQETGAGDGSRGTEEGQFHRRWIRSAGLDRFAVRSTLDRLPAARDHGRGQPEPAQLQGAHDGVEHHAPPIGLLRELLLGS
jgi:hypothetical protein